ncbi:hypothetical protein CF98_05375 [Halopseudomonas bauzanensis]|nr:hypothetical protein CF98_05375 [Halopseudomonas bauzanensis]
MKYIALITIVLLTLFSLSFQWKVRARNPLFLFVAFNGFFSLGTVLSLDLDVEADNYHLWVVLVTSTVIFLYVLFLYNYRRARTIDAVWLSRYQVPAFEEKTRKVWFVYLVSALLVFMYYEFLVGYNLFYDAMTVGVDDFVTLRLQSYAGENYTGAGIINQFKNTLLPIAYFTLCVIYARAVGRARFLVFITLTMPFFLWAIMGTGQRTFLVFSFACFGLFLWGEGLKIKILPVMVVLAGVVMLFGLYSVFLGRTESLSFGETMEQLFFRLFYANQRGTVEGFRYIFDKEIVYGAEWFQILKGFIPGVKGSTLSNEIHYVLFRSDRGTVPVSLWVSMYYNFGLLLLPVITIILLKLIELSKYVIIMLPKNVFSTMAWSFFFFYLAILPISNPFQILNNGLIGLWLIYLLIVLRVGSDQIGLMRGGR